MEAVRLCEPSELYNLLNQRRGGVSRVAEINYLCLIDARESQDYCSGHIVTARNVPPPKCAELLLQGRVELDSMRHVVVYDQDCSSAEDGGPALDCARVLVKTSFSPVQVVRGGFRRFSALYTFMRTEKVLYSISELEALKVYPVEIVPGLLYMGDQDHGSDSSVLSELQIRAVVSISQSDADQWRSAEEKPVMLNIPVEDSATSDLYSSFERICCFIDSNVEVGSRVLMVSRLARSRCSAAAIAFLMHHRKLTLQEAWTFMLQCKPSMKPNSGFVEQLLNWELHIKGAKLTDISQPGF